MKVMAYVGLIQQFCTLVIGLIYREVQRFNRPCTPIPPPPLEQYNFVFCKFDLQPELLKFIVSSKVKANLGKLK